MSGPLPEGWEGMTFLALDFETTGLDHRRDRVVEIGALRFSRRSAAAGAASAWREEAALAALVDPGMPMPPAARAIHGISDEDLEGAPPFSALAPALLSLCRGAIIVAHNAPFDLSFLRSELDRAGMGARTFPSLDTRLLAKAAFPRAGSYRLGSLVALLGLEGGRAHRALDDARACMGLLAACAAALSPGKTPAVTATTTGTAAGTARA